MTGRTLSGPGTSDPGISDPGISDPGISDPGISDPGASGPARPDSAPTRGRWRLVRAGVLGAVSMLLAGTAHLLGGGALPGLPVLGLLTAAVGTVAVLVTGRRCRLFMLLPVLLVEQAGLHLAFGLSAGRMLGPGAPVCASAAAAHTGMIMSGCAAPLASSATTAVAPSALPVGGMGSTAVGGVAAVGAMWPMLLAHLVATVLTAWLLARGEQLAWRLGARLVGLAIAPRGRRPRPVRGLVVAVRWQPVGLVLRDSAGPRAPPGRMATAR